MPKPGKRKNRRKASRRKPSQQAALRWADASESVRATTIAKSLLRDAATVKAGGKSRFPDSFSPALVSRLLMNVAVVPGNNLADALFEEIQPVIQVLADWAVLFGELEKKITDAGMRQQAAQAAQQLDFVLTRITGELRGTVSLRANSSRSTDLLCDAIHMAIGDGGEAARLIRRYAKINPQDSRDENGNLIDGGWPDQFAWEAYQRVKALEQIATDFPEMTAMAAQKMHAWPMLWHRHFSRQAQFERMADRLKLGEAYPLDASKKARFNPDTPLVDYLDGLVFRLHDLWVTLRYWQANTAWKFNSPEEETKAIARYWHQWPDDPPAEEVVEVLSRCRELPPLNKRTAADWCREVVMPLILLTDGRDYQNVTEPALKAFAKQNGVKSQAIFASRLGVKVKGTLRSMARDAT